MKEKASSYIKYYKNEKGPVIGSAEGKVIKKEKHPDADKLSVCMVDVGEDEPLQIVCGAANVTEGINVPVARDNSRIPGPLHGQPQEEGGTRRKKAIS